MSRYAYDKDTRTLTSIAGADNLSVVDSALSDSSTNAVQNKVVKGAIDAKQDTYASDSSKWDTTPTANSTKPVTSGGVKTELDKKLGTYSNESSSWDTTPTANSTKPVTSGGLKTAFDSRDTAIAKCECLILSANGVSALPYTFSNAAIETDMVCINSVLSNPSAQLSDWTVNTDTAGQATISGTISGSTNITIYMMKSR